MKPIARINLSSVALRTGGPRLIPREEITMREDIAALLELERKTRLLEGQTLVVGYKWWGRDDGDAAGVCEGLTPMVINIYTR